MSEAAVHDTFNDTVPRRPCRNGLNTDIRTPPPYDNICPPLPWDQLHQCYSPAWLFTSITVGIFPLEKLCHSDRAESVGRLL